MLGLEPRPGTLVPNLEQTPVPFQIEMPRKLLKINDLSSHHKQNHYGTVNVCECVLVFVGILGDVLV